MVLRIALDMDDTLAATLKHVFGTYGRPIPTEWMFYKNGGNISYEKMMRDIKRTWERRWGEIRPIEPGLAAIVEELNGLGKVDIVTVGFQEQKAEWLRLHGIKYDELVPVRDGRDKAKLDYDVFIDDSPANYQSFLEAGKTCILFDAPYNQDIDTIYRIRSLGEAAAIILSVKS